MAAAVALSVKLMEYCKRLCKKKPSSSSSPTNKGTTNINHRHFTTSFLIIFAIVTFFTPTASQQADQWGSLSAGISSNQVSGSLTPAAGFKCRVCEDVARTWRNTFQCVGMSSNNDMSPRITQDGPGCMPTSNCNQFKGSLKATCEDLQKSFRDSAEQAGRIATLIEEKKGSYEICEDLGKCQPQTNQIGSKCFIALNTNACNDDIECKLAREDCDDTCFACFWQVRVWPVFTSECKRSSGGSKPPPESKKKRLRRLLMLPGLGSPPIDPQPENAKSPAELMNFCWETWDEFEKSPKARFFSGMVDSLGQLPWEANTVCKCLGKCPYDTFEGIQLLSACDWQEDDPQITAALFPDISPALNSAIRDQSKLTNQGLTSQDKENSNRYWNGAR